MNDIRNSIHNLYNESLDLKSRIEDLCDEISNMDIKLTYKMEDDLPYDLKFDILSVVKEAITNCVKHSNATELLIMKDNNQYLFLFIVNSSFNINLIYLLLF